MADDALVRLEHADALDLLGGLRAESVDCIITDPPYESLERHRAKGTPRLVKSWFDTFPNRRFGVLLLECYRVLKPARHLYILCDRETEHVMTELAEITGFYVWNSIVWRKVKVTADGRTVVDPGMGYHGRRCHERILMIEKRTVPYTGIRHDPLGPRSDPPGEGRQLLVNYNDVLDGPKARDGYPTEKPVEILLPLVEASVHPGELVLDPFAGSGSVGAAVLAAGQGRRCVLGDVSPESMRWMSERFNVTPHTRRLPAAAEALP